jgi:hypothetical protein
VQVGVIIAMVVEGIKLSSFNDEEVGVNGSIF